ncbi:MAG: DUF4164 family protein [Alphaproteobacteria bacterium]|nr:DUF4164 family protein [Alphaproteobacteria bacterium]MBU0798482.1 DUF4164 family protein [Alphaproteobacteria bacterium]MBU0886727.1 DUF4164 family protein [Alphaproteobacteria bacterium]MBU1812545.1 DUF4164 family protein [Alphaproteobacteria bacterium]
MSSSPAIDAALHRLSQSIDRLDAAAAQPRADGTAEMDVQGEAEIGALKAELAAIQARYAELSQTTSVVTQRLDSAIDRLKLVLEN